MKVSYNWLKEYIDFDMSPEDLGDLLTEIGLEVEGLEKFESLQGGLEGIVIGEVLEKDTHPNADRLSVAKVDVGGESTLQIVCGASNLEQGQKVVVALEGATLYPIDGDPFKIKKSKIRGVESRGMICAEDEIGLGHDHDGILVLPPDTKKGIPASSYFEIEIDYIYEIGLTPNRSDATSHLGVAEDVAAALKINYNQAGQVKRPSVDQFKVVSTDLPIDVVVENTAACPRYSGLTIRNLKVGPSPEWLVNRLKAIGVRSMNNVVDITNFILHELGQPLHAFDLRHVTDNKIIVQNLPEGTVFQTLDEVERKLSAEDLMICDGQSNGMCIAGVFGGIKSGVKDDTTEIFLESAHFEGIQLRRSSTRHQLRTDAAKVFEKGSDPNITVYALKRAALLLEEYAGGEVSSEVVDLYPTPIEKKQINVRYDHVNRLIGQDISQKEIHDILDALSIDRLSDDGDEMTVAIPTNKFDVTREADVIEEILRIYGFNRIEIPDQIRSSLSFSKQPDPHKLRNLAARYLAGNGFHEIMNLSLTQSKYTETLLPFQEEALVYIK